MKQKNLSLILFILIPFLLWGQVKRSPNITIPELLEHVKYLSSEKLEGRKTGTLGAELAFKYIANEFKNYGLKPVGDNSTYLQKFEFISEIHLGSKNVFQVSFDNKMDKKIIAMVQTDYIPLGFSSDGEFTGEVVFAGYGISASDKNYDDYKDIDVKDKAVIVFRDAPGEDSTMREFDKFASLRYKANKAKELGAKALIIVSTEKTLEEDKLMKLSFDRSLGRAGIIAINITRKFLDQIITVKDITAKKLMELIDSTKSPNSFYIDGLHISLLVELNEKKANGFNVVGYLESKDKVFGKEYLIIGAHYDHLGYGGENSGSMKPDTIAIHPGADDNASGVSGLLELAQLFSYQRDKLKRSILFIAFAGEEMGLLGSGHYTKYPLLPLESSIAMLNLDMLGSLRDKKLIIYGTGTSSIFDSLLHFHNRDTVFTLKLNKDGYGPSDHSSFYAKQMPVMHFFTDLTEYYHRPYDTYEKLNYEGLQKVVQFVSSISFDLSTIKEKPNYVSVETPKSSSNIGRGARVFVGTIPDFGEQAEGMKISGVRDGSPAAKAGMVAGDIIIKFGKVDIKNIYDYTYALGEYKAGDVVDVLIKRNNETISMKVTLEKRN